MKTLTVMTLLSTMALSNISGTANGGQLVSAIPYEAVSNMLDVEKLVGEEQLVFLNNETDTDEVDEVDEADVEPEEELMLVWEEMMAASGETVYAKRKAFIDEFIPVFQSYYSYISQDREQVSLSYESHAAKGNLLEQLKEVRQRDRILGYSTRGIHKDDLIMQLGDFPIKREGSQGQNKTYLIALKLAQFEFLKRTGSRTTPIVLLDDIFDKLDASRVEQIVKLVAGDSFGQIFVTDTNRDHLDKILRKIEGDYKLFEVDGGVVSERCNEEEEI